MARYEEMKQYGTSMCTPHIIYFVRNSFGIDRYWPFSTDARMVAELTGQATLTERVMEILHRHGATFEETSDPRAYRAWMDAKA